MLIVPVQWLKQKSPHTKASCTRCKATRVYAVQDELAEQTLKAMCRKFSESAKMWLRHISWLLTRDRADAARKVLDRSFTALPQRKHIKVGQCNFWQP